MKMDDKSMQSLMSLLKELAKSIQNNFQSILNNQKQLDKLKHKIDVLTDSATRQEKTNSDVVFLFQGLTKTNDSQLEFNSAVSNHLKLEITYGGNEAYMEKCELKNQEKPALTLVK
jgi:lysozyme family protein